MSAYHGPPSTTLEMLIALAYMLVISTLIVGPLLHLHWRNNRWARGQYTAREIYRWEKKQRKQMNLLARLRRKQNR